MPSESYEIVPSLINGEWLSINKDKYTNVYNPAKGEIISKTPMCGNKELDKAVEAAEKAFVSWSSLPSNNRAQILFNYRSLIKENLEEIAKIISTENGKTLAEAKGDIQRGFEVVEFACGISQLSKGESLAEVAPNIDATTIREPLGICAGISPFNFPAMVPMWMFPLAIACGNTFILKPSEKVPLTAVKLVKLFEKAGLPKGVLNLIHGGKEIVDGLCTHPKISAVSFVGSSIVGHHVYSLASRNGKRVQAGGAAKNALLVMRDAEPDSTLRAIMSSSFGCAGQRCMAGSLLVGVGDVKESLKEKVSGAIDKLVVGDPIKNEKTEMGPVIDSNSQERISKIIEKVEKNGASLINDGRKLIDNEGYFIGPTLFDNVNPDMTVFSEEIFGPVLSILNPKNLTEAIQWLNKLNYGNGATIFTTSGVSAKEFRASIKCGMVGINVGVPAPMAMFPFSGWNESFYGDLHMQGSEGVMFYTRQKVILSRWDDSYKHKQGW